MKECLVTHLQDSVDNDNLRKYGVVRFTAENITDGNSSWIKIWDNNGGHVVVNGGTAYAEAARTTSLGSEFDITSDAFSFWLSDGNSDVEVTGVYNITKVSLGANVSVNIEDVCYNSDGLVIEGYKTPSHSALFVGDIDTLEDRDAGSIIIKKLQENTCVVLTGVSGNVKNLNKFGFDLNGFNSMIVQFYTLPDSANTPSDIHGDIAAFATFNADWKTKLIEIKTQQGNVGKLYGNIESFRDYTNIEAFNLNMIEVTGNLSTALGRMTNLSLIGIGGHKEAFDLADLFDTLHNNGKTSGSIQIWAGENKTVNGGPWVNGSSVTFNMNGWTIE
jgi:hypothetical protein